MGSRIRTRLIAICLGVTAVVAPQGVVAWSTAAAEPMPRDAFGSRLVRIEAAPPAPLPPLVPIPSAVALPNAAATQAPATLRSLPIVALPPLRPMAHAAAPLAVAPLAIASLPVAVAPPPSPPQLPPPLPQPPPLLPPLPVPAIPVALAPPLPVAPQASLAVPPLPVSLAPPIPVAPPLPLAPPAPLPQVAATLPPPIPPLPAAAPPAPVVPPAMPQPQVAASQPAPAPPLPAPAPLSAGAPAPVPAAPAPVAAAAGGKPTDAITIASFNIQDFGESKIAKQHVVDVLSRVVRGFDIVAVQEVRAKSDSVIPQFISAINGDGSRYQFVIGPRLGRTVSKEQYTFIYDTTRIEVDPSSVGTSPNPGDRLHRPPLQARFRVRANPPESGFSFWLVDTHTDPDEVAQEVNALADVFMEMKALRPDEDDVILLGDLNAGPPQFGRIKQIPNVGWAVSGVTTNTRRTKTYENIIFVRVATTEDTGRWGVLDLQSTFGLSLDKALEVSDHNPVWAAFRPWETQ
ncbi:MAG: endonuclease/exonuclease/phosphatase family protein, partial [Planctomycetia bacterium]